MASSRIHIPANEKNDGWIGIAIMICIPPISWLGLILGVRKLLRARKNNVKRYFRQYEEICYGRDSVDFREISELTGRSVDTIERHFLEMQARGYLDNGVIIDHARKRIVLEPAAFTGAHNADIESVRVGPVEIKWAPRGKDGHEAPAPQPRQEGPRTVSLKKESEPIIVEPVAEPEKKPGSIKGKKSDSTDTLEQLMREIRSANEAIADEAVSERIERIGALTASISAVVREKPDKADDVRKFLNYYLPTTLKLLRSYALMEKQSYQGDNIVESRKKIEGILDTLVRAFEEQQDKLFSEEVIDVDAEIQVLETMMASDGLIRPAGTDMRAVAAARKKG